MMSLPFLLSFLDSFRTWACDEEAVRLLASVRLLCDKSFGKMRKEKIFGVFWLFPVCLKISTENCLVHEVSE